MAAARVIRVPLVEEATRWAPPAALTREARAVPAKALAPRADEAEAPLMFDLEGFADAQAVVEPVSESARAARGTVERLLAAGPDDLAVSVACALCAPCPAASSQKLLRHVPALHQAGVAGRLGSQSSRPVAPPTVPAQSTTSSWPPHPLLDAPARAYRSAPLPCPPLPARHP